MKKLTSVLLTVFMTCSLLTVNGVWAEETPTPTPTETATSTPSEEPTATPEEVTSAPTITPTEDIDTTLPVENENTPSEIVPLEENNTPTIEDAFVELSYATSDDVVEEMGLFYNEEKSQETGLRVYSDGELFYVYGSRGLEQDYTQGWAILDDEGNIGEFLPEVQTFAVDYTTAWNQAIAAVNKTGNPNTDVFITGLGLTPYSGSATGTAVATCTETVKDYAGVDHNDACPINTADEFLWGLLNAKNMKLMNDLDLGGYNNTVWPAITISTGILVDGDGHKVYNMYQNAGQFGLFGKVVANASTDNLFIQNLILTNSKKENAPTYSALFVGQFLAGHLYNCGTENSLLSGANITGGFVQGWNGSGDGYLKTIDNCHTINVHVKATSCGSTLSEAMRHADITNSFSVGGSVIVAGGHSGGFESCSVAVNVTNCFSVVDVYGNTATGSFAGIMHDAYHNYTNCYTSGKIEGNSAIGGFAATQIDTTSTTIPDANSSTFTNCYSTSMVGMDGGGAYMGSFLGGSIAGYTTTFKNCYGAGEVGSLATVANDLTHTANVGGFVGSIVGNTTTFTNAYYDKQTTAMREWEVGTQTAAADTITGLNGVLTTTTTKAGAGLTDNPGTTGFTGFTNNGDWEFVGDHYPQLQSFTNPTTFLDQYQDLVKAYSLASVSTVLLEPWEKDYQGNALPSTVYDTVRDITLKAYCTTTDDSKWTKGKYDATAETYTPATTSLYGDTVNVLTLGADGNGTYIDEYAPGIEWLTVERTVGNETGFRRLRIVPTMNIEAGESKSIEYTYDHADDMKMAYSTAPRLAVNATDMEMGVYPDIPVTDTAVQPTVPGTFAANDNKYVDVDASHVATDSKLNVEIHKVISIDHSTEVINLGASVDLTGGDGAQQDDKWNEVKAFTLSDRGRYVVSYYWSLNDGRYLRDAKIITVNAENRNVTANVVNTRGEAYGGLALDVYQDSETQNLVKRASDATVSQPYQTPSNIAFKNDRTDVKIKKVTITMGNPQLGQYIGSIEVDDLAVGDTITVPMTNYGSLFTVSGVDYAHVSQYNAVYTVAAGTNGEMILRLDTDYTDAINNVLFRDISWNTVVTITVEYPYPIPDLTPGPFLVTFLDCEGNTIKIDWVPYQGSSSAPGGYGLSDVGNVSSNMDVRPANCPVGRYKVPNTAEK